MKAKFLVIAGTIAALAMSSSTYAAKPKNSNKHNNQNHSARHVSQHERESARLINLKSESSQEHKVHTTKGGVHPVHSSHMGMH